MVDATTARFSMMGTREALDLVPGALHIERQIEALEGAVNQNPGLAFDLAKSLIESVCKTLLRDRGHTVSEDLELSALFKETVTSLRMLPDDLSDQTELRNSLKKTVGGLHTVIQGICELRNAQGFASHGKYGYALALDSIQAQLVARAADTVVHFLFAAHKNYPSNLPTKRLIYEQQEDLNSLIDEANEVVRIFDLEYRPSEVLFAVDPEAYRDALANVAETQSAEEAGAIATAGEVNPESQVLDTHAEHF